MLKYLIIFIVIACFALFYPYRDLYVKEDTFSATYTLVHKGYWTREACVEAAKAQRAEEYRCSKRTMIGSFMGTSAKYKKTGLDTFGE